MAYFYTLKSWTTPKIQNYKKKKNIYWLHKSIDFMEAQILYIVSIILDISSMIRFLHSRNEKECTKLSQFQIF